MARVAIKQRVLLRQLGFLGGRGSTESEVDDIPPLAGPPTAGTPPGPPLPSTEA